MAQVCRRHGIYGTSSATFYTWKAKYCGMDASPTSRVQALEDENTKLKRLFVRAILNRNASKGLVGQE